MSEEYRMSDGEVIALAEGMSDLERLQLIEKVAAMGTEQSERIAMWLMRIHLAEKAKPRVLH
jgi:hypothetical protein